MQHWERHCIFHLSDLTGLYMRLHCRIMQHVIRISEIKNRAERIGSSLRAACEACGVEASTAYRWLSGQSNPGIVSYGAACAALEEWLDEQERLLLVELQQRHAGEPARGAQ